MAIIQSEARFLGLDLSALKRSAHQAWAELQNSAPFSWLTPEFPVVVFERDGSETLWLGSERRMRVDEKIKPRFIALELPEDLQLSRTLAVPMMSEPDIARAAALHARALSPFADHDLVWGFRSRPSSAGGIDVDIALASRKQIAQYIQASSAHAGGTPEVWVGASAGAPIVFGGYGEGLRRAQGIRGRWIRCGLLASALVLIGAIAVTPTLQLRSRAIEAVAAYDAAVARTGALVRDREALMQSVEKLGALSELLAGRIEPTRVLARLTQALPDDTALQSFTLKGQKVTITGLTANASALMQILGEQPGVRDVRSPNPTTRVGGANSKESFVVEFSLDAQEFGVAMAPAKVAAEALLSSLPATPASAASQTSAPPMGVASSPAGTVAAPVVAPGAMVPVFGGSPAQLIVKPGPAKPERRGAP